MPFFGEAGGGTSCAGTRVVAIAASPLPEWHQEALCIGRKQKGHSLHIPMQCFDSLWEVQGLALWWASGEMGILPL